MSDLDRRNLLAAAGILGVAAIAKRGQAGPLTPPPGPVASSGKTINDAEPRVAIKPVPGQIVDIPGPGSYYLTANADSGIRVVSDDVTIDLNGFVARAADYPAIFQGALTDVKRLRVHNGSIDCGSSGAGAVVLELRNRDATILEDLTIFGAGDVTLGVRSGDGATVRRCVFYVPEGSGFSSPLTLGRFAVVENCLFANCATGASVGGNSLLSDCVFIGKGTTPANTGTITLDLAIVRRCSFYLYRTALRCESACIVEDCLFNNANIGVALGSLSTFARNVVDFCTTGVDARNNDRVSILDNRFQRATTGIDLSVGTGKCTVARNTFVECTTPISSTGTHAIGPAVTPANIATATNPFANIVIA